MTEMSVDNPKLDPADLAAGTDNRKPVVYINHKFHNCDSIVHKKRQLMKILHNATTWSALAVEALNAAFQWFDSIEQWQKDIYDTSMGGVVREK